MSVSMRLLVCVYQCVCLRHCGTLLREIECVLLCVCVCVSVFVCVFVCVVERERERVSECVCRCVYVCDGDDLCLRTCEVVFELV